MEDPLVSVCCLDLEPTLRIVGMLATWENHLVIIPCHDCRLLFSFTHAC